MLKVVEREIWGRRPLSEQNSEIGYYSIPNPPTTSSLILSVVRKKFGQPWKPHTVRCLTSSLQGSLRFARVLSLEKPRRLQGRGHRTAMWAVPTLGSADRVFRATRFTTDFVFLIGIRMILQEKYSKTSFSVVEYDTALS